MGHYDPPLSSSSNHFPHFHPFEGELSRFKEMEAICQFALFADDRPPPSGNCYLWAAQSTFREFSVKSYQVGFLYQIHRSPGKILVQGRVYHEFDTKKLLTKSSGRERGIFYSGPEEKVDSI